VAVAGGAGRPPAARGAPPTPGQPAEAKENLPFAEVAIQAVFHDLLSDDRAFAPNSHINLLHLRARYEAGARTATGTGTATGTETEPDAWRLERFALVDVLSLFPVSLLSAQPSWRLEAAWQRNRDLGCDACTPFGIGGGVGYSVQTALHRREVYYLLIEAAAEFDRAFQSQHRAGFGLAAGVVLDLAGGWRLGLQGRRVRFTEGQRGDVGQLELEQRLALTRNTELVLHWRGVEDYREAKLGLGYHF
jgi:hypothetical protein